MKPEKEESQQELCKEKSCSTLGFTHQLKFLSPLARLALLAHCLVCVTFAVNPKLPSSFIEKAFERLLGTIDAVHHKRGVEQSPEELYRVSIGIIFQVEIATMFCNYDECTLRLSSGSHSHFSPTTLTLSFTLAVLSLLTSFLTSHSSRHLSLLSSSHQALLFTRNLATHQFESFRPNIPASVWAPLFADSKACQQKKEAVKVHCIRHSQIFYALNSSLTSSEIFAAKNLTLLRCRTVGVYPLRVCSSKKS